MRTEVKAAIVVGLVVFVGAIIWAVNSSEKADNIPFDLPADEANPAVDVDLASSESAAPRRAAAPRRRPPAGRQERAQPSATSYEPLAPPAEPPKPEPAAAKPGPTASPAQRTAAATPQSAPAMKPPPRAAGSSAAQGGPGRGSARPAGKTPAATEHKVAARLEGLRKPPPRGSSYTVQLGDTLISIAREHYGDDKYWTAIQAANPDVDPLRLQQGQVLVLPAKERVLRGGVRPAAEKAREAARKPGRPTYVVEEGDTLIAIARNVLKDASRYMEIYELNRDQLESPDHLPVGLELRLPPPGKKPAQKKQEKDKDSD